MVMGARPRGRREDRTAAFVEQVTDEETTQLHCMIPDALHRELKMLAVQDRSTMTALVTEALKQYVAGRS